MPFELLRAIRRSLNFMPFFRIFGSKIIAKNAGKSLRWPSNVPIFCVLIKYNMYLRQFKHVLDEYDHRNQQILHFRNCTSNCSNSSRVLELSRTLSNPYSQKIELNNPDTTQQAWPHHMRFACNTTVTCILVSSQSSQKFWEGAHPSL